jgi:hypothetical protein
MALSCTSQLEFAYTHAWTALLLADPLGLPDGIKITPEYSKNQPLADILTEEK